MNEQKKYETIKKLVDTNGNKNRSAIALGCTGRTIDQQETLYGYYHVFEQILSDYGIPYMFYTDRHAIFEYKQKNSPSLENDTFTQFGYACSWESILRPPASLRPKVG